MKKATTYISKLENINKEIKKSWAIISHENVSPKTRNRDADLKEIYRTIKDLINRRVQNKLHLQAINSGFKKFGDFPKDNNYINIFWLSELKDMKRNWEIISNRHTILPSKKKKNKSSLTVNEIFSRAMIQKTIRDLDFKIRDFEARLDKFNTETEFDDTTGDIIINPIEEVKVEKTIAPIKAAA